MLNRFRFRLLAAARLGFLFTVGLLAARGAAGQGMPVPNMPHWEWQNPLPTGYELTKIQGFNDSTAVATGSHGTVIRTTDRGRTWQAQNAGTTLDIRHASFSDAQHGWLAYWTPPTNPLLYHGPGELRRTTDGGQTWTRVLLRDPNESVRIFAVQALSATEAYVHYEAGSCRNPNLPCGGGIGGPARLRHTTNGGQTWTEVNSSLPISYIGTQIHFLTSTTGYQVGTYVYRTTDGGASWRNAAPDSTILTDFEYVRLTAVGPRQLWLTVKRRPWSAAQPGDPILYHSADGGLTWQVQLTSASSYDGIRDLAFADSLHGVALKADGHETVTTADGGLTWQWHRPGIGRWAQSLCLTPDGGGWLVGLGEYGEVNGAYVGRTPDFGATWAPCLPNVAPHRLTNLCVPDPTHAWAEVVGDTVLLRLTRRAGPWERVPVGGTSLVNWRRNNYRIQGSTFVDQDTGFVHVVHHQVGVEHFLLTTTDAGRTWTQRPIPALAGQDFADFKVTFATGRRGLLLTGTGPLLVTQDGGQSWQAPPVALTGSYCAQWLDARTAYVGADSSSLLRTFDGGHSWQVMRFDSALNYAGGPNLPPFPFPYPRRPVTAFTFLTPLIGFQDGMMTRNGGRTWEWVPGRTYPGRLNVLYGRRRVAWGFRGNEYYRTTDQGQTWQLAASAGSIPEGIGVDTYNAWAVGSNGKILHYSEKFIQTDTALTRTRFCLGATPDSLAVPFTLEGTFALAEQDFRVELSNPKGRFRPGETTLVGRGAASPLTARLPASLLPGTYRLRVIRADSSVLGADNGVDLLVSRRPAAVALAPADSVAICAGDSVQLSAPAGFSHYQWSTGATTPAVWVRAAGAYTVRVGGALDCLSPASASVRVRVKPVPPLPVITAAPQPSGLVVLTSSAATGNQWFLNGQPITAATGPTYTVSTSAQNGAYTVQVTRAGCASPVAVALPVGVVGTAEAAATPALSIAPNPARTSATVRTTGGAALLRITLTDLSGREIARVAAAGPETVVPLAGVAAGTYLLCAVRAGAAPLTHRLVVER